MVSDDILLVSYDNNSPKDQPVLICGRKTKIGVEVITAFAGAEASELYKKLATPTEKKNDRV